MGTTKHCAIVVACPQDPCKTDPALCGYVDTSGDDDWGWSFIWMMMLGTGLYAGGGLAYNHKQRGMPLEAGSLPHADFWMEVRALAMDGVVFARAAVEEAREGRAEGEYEPLSDPQPAGARPPPRKKLEAVAEEEEEEEGEGWEGAERDVRELVKKDVHSSMAPIRVEIQRTEDTGAAMPWEGVE